MSPIKHAESSVQKWGGLVNDYMVIHRFLDSTKLHYTDWRHRAILHNTFGIGLCEQLFGDYIVNSDQKKVEVRYIAMQHIQEDLGWIPTVKEWLKDMPAKGWRIKKVKVTGRITDGG